VYTGYDNFALTLFPESALLRFTEFELDASPLRFDLAGRAIKLERFPMEP
jgi:hypothetical protein